MKTSNIILLGIVFIVIIAIGAAAGSSGGKTGGVSRDKKPTETCTISVASQVTSVMLEYINVTNKNTDAHFCFSYNMLDETFNFAKGDILTFEAITQSGYTLNGWRFSDGTFDHHNPLELAFDGDFTITVWIMRTP